MDEYGGPIFLKDDIRTSRKSSIVKTIPKSRAMKTPPNDHFGLGVDASNGRHVPAARKGRLLEGGKRLGRDKGSHV
jgi:hypothetical protein